MQLPAAAWCLRGHMYACAHSARVQGHTHVHMLTDARTHTLGRPQRGGFTPLTQHFLGSSESRKTNT